MYLSHYNLKTEPFKITTDPEFLWLGEKHKEALATLKYGILGNKGILLLTGDVGTGKTTLIHALLNSLGEDTIVATVPDPGLDKMDFFNYVANALNIQKTFYSKGDFTLYFSHFLKSAYAENKKVLLIIDEAQRLNKDLLEEIRLLSNIELQNTKLINLFFVGQKEFNDIILLEENKALRQRISLRYNIDPLNLEETREYIKYRILVAGSKKSLFTSNAVSEIYSFSKGYPRLINILCDYALLGGFVRDKNTIGRQIVQECAEDLKIPRENGAHPPPPMPPRGGEMEGGETGPETPASAENREKPLGRSLFKQAGLWVLLFLLLISLGFNFFDPSKARNLYPSLNRMWQIVQSRMASVQHWVKQDKPSKVDENNGVSVVLPPRDERTEEDESAPVSSPENIGNSPSEGTGTLHSEKPSVKIQGQPGAAATQAHPPPMPGIRETIPTTPANRSEATPNDISPIMDEKPGSQDQTAALDNIPDESETVPPEKNIVLQEDKTGTPPKIYLEEASPSPLSQGVPLTADPLQARKPPAMKSVIFFESNSFSLSADALDSLGKIMAFSKQHPEADIVIKGYTDHSGPFVYNERLSIFRAYSVKSYLVDHGLDPMKVKAFGMGPRPALDDAGNKIPAQLTRSVEVEMYVE